jgi:DNA (cytosine-5)-methyltransferase 1
MNAYPDHLLNIKNRLISKLQSAELLFAQNKQTAGLNVSKDLRTWIDTMNDKADSSATSAFTNIVTGLAIKTEYPEIDVRYHQVQIQVPERFSHRDVSEQSVFPFLRDNHLDGAKSGWQTRTFERPKPYTLDYEENIRGVKKEFLAIYDAIEERGEDAGSALEYLLLGQVVRRHTKRIDLIEPTIDDIDAIMKHFENHFFAKYTSQGAARLPVLSLYALYQLIMPELKRFDGLKLAELELHSAADSRTGATGDIEIKLDESVFEAIEVKHNIAISMDLIIDSAQKLKTRRVTRFYILTTHKNCTPSDAMTQKMKEIKESTGCQVIANGILPTLKYYLRLVENPSDIFPFYTKLLKNEPAISHEHRVKWNEIVLPKR